MLQTIGSRLVASELIEKDRTFRVGLRPRFRQTPVRALRGRQILLTVPVRFLTGPSNLQNGVRQVRAGPENEAFGFMFWGRARFDGPRFGDLTSPSKNLTGTVSKIWQSRKGLTKPGSQTNPNLQGRATTPSAGVDGRMHLPSTPGQST
jgi:hypothetical protein